MINKWIPAALLLVLAACSADETAVARRPQIFPQTYTERVVMRDGLALGTDVHLPGPFYEGKDAPVPVILVRTPYGKVVGEPSGFKAWALEKGIALVVQDTRGRYSSDGTDAVFQDDGFGPRQDGYDTVEWIASQPWSNGRVCTFGPSALGITQTMLAAANPPHLTCQFILVAPADLYAHAAFQGGVMREELLEKWLEFQDAMLWFDLIKAHPVYDDYWKYVDALSVVENVSVPAVHVGGWFDIFSEGTLHAFRGWQHDSAEGARGKQKLVMGPGDHIQTALFLDHMGPAANQTVAGIDIQLLAQRWFARYLLDEENDVEAEPAVRYYVMDGSQEHGAWRTAADWPPPSVIWSLTLTPSKMLIDTPAAVTTFTFTHDPADPVPTLGGRNLFNKSGAFDQASLAPRSDRLVFASPTLTEPRTIAGEVKLTLSGALDGDDGYWVVQLLDLGDDGTQRLVTEGSLRAQLRNGRELAEPVVPGEFVTYDISVYSTAWRFLPGHRIGVAIAGSNAPRLAVYPEDRQFSIRTGESFLALPLVDP